mgnify:CR=1 FL=1|tara:strand:- start:79 stop:546 length:468 start_codon:yes stop_codon:yes gene_type:complete
MKNILYLFFIFFFITNCTLDKVIKHHGVHFLEKKQQKVFINKSNKNDIIALLGPPSNISSFDEGLWFYVERASSSSKLTQLGKRELLTNNVLILELDIRGVLKEKIFLNKDAMQEIEFTNYETNSSISQKQTIIYDFLSSVRQKINNPQGSTSGN